MTDRQLGDWVVTRSIHDARTGSITACNGRARLTPVHGRIRYDEAVVVVLAGNPLRATRTYFYASANGIVVATFDDGRPFFTTTLAPDGTASAVHRCGDDLYRVWFELRNSGWWQTLWDVGGTKSLHIRTTYTRVSEN